MEIKIKKLYEDSQIPTRGSEYAAGYDLYACLERNVYFASNTVEMIPTGIGFEIPEGYFGAVYPRSGLASKQGLRLANCVGVIDCGYINQVYVPLINDSNGIRVVQNGDRIAQIIFQPYLDVELNEINEPAYVIGKVTNSGEVDLKW